MMSRRKPFSASGLWILLLALVASGCRQQMADQPKGLPYGASDLFSDGAIDRPAVPDTLSQSDPVVQDAFGTGKANGLLVVNNPVTVTRDLLMRGQERYNIFCSPCHDRAGSGDGMIVQRGYTRPPSFHTDVLRSAPAGHFFDVITNGFGKMPAYAEQIPVADRWAIVAYIRALQLSQHATLDSVPADERGRLNP